MVINLLAVHWKYNSQLFGCLQITASLTFMQFNITLPWRDNLSNDSLAKDISSNDNLSKDGSSKRQFIKTAVHRTTV